MAAELLDAFADLRVTVTDFDDAMANAAGGRLRAFGDRAMTRQADAAALQFADATFDVVFSFIMLHHTIRWRQALEEAVRVLRPGGQLIGYDLLASGPMRLLHQAEDSERRMIHRDELRPALHHLNTTDVRVRVGVGGVVARFSARRDSVGS